MAASHVITCTLALTLTLTLTLTLSLSLGQAGGVLLNALAMVAMLAGVTTLMMLLYRWRCYKLMYGWLLFSVASLLYSFGGLVLEQLLEVYAIATDRPTLSLLLYNFAAIG